MPASYHVATCICIDNDDTICEYRCKRCGKVVSYCEETGEIQVPVKGDLNVTHVYQGGALSGSFSMGLDNGDLILPLDDHETRGIRSERERIL